MFKKLGLAAAAGLVFFFVLEGLCSSVVVAYQLLAGQEHRTLSGPSVHYDRELGWVTLPNYYEPNYFAPGIYLRTNSRGFRADEEFTQQVPPGKVRLICSGDSQTFGDGVGNPRTWCQDLASLDDRVQPINLGETGYGVDQMYLWYKREGAVLDHDVHLFAFVTDDFRRVQNSVVGGYGKPVLKLKNEELVVTNVPVPQRSRLLHFLALKPNPLREFRSLALAASLVERFSPPPDTVFSKGPTEEQAQLLSKMIDNLQAMEQRKNATLVMVYLPSRNSDYFPGGSSPAWRKWVRAECQKRGIPLIDLIPDFQKLPITMKDGMFIWPGSSQYFAEAPGHYNDQGQEWVAREIYSGLLTLPGIAKKLPPSPAQAGADATASVPRENSPRRSM